MMLLSTTTSLAQEFPTPGAYLESVQYSYAGSVGEWDSLNYTHALYQDSFRFKERIHRRVNGEWEHYRGWIHFGDENRTDSSYIYSFSDGDSTNKVRRPIESTYFVMRSRVSSIPVSSWKMSSMKTAR